MTPTVSNHVQRFTARNRGMKPETVGFSLFHTVMRVSACDDHPMFMAESSEPPVHRHR